MDRPNNTYGGQNRASALRNSRSPPRNDHRSGAGAIHSRKASQGKALSPLRSRIAQQQQNQNTMQPSYGTGGANSMRRSVPDDNSEEIMYERRRQEELRLQIQEKERELETVSSKHQERLNRHAGIDSASQQQFNGVSSQGNSFAYPHRSGSNSGTGGYLQSQQTNNKRGSNSPLRSRDNSQGFGYAGGSYARSSSSNALAVSATETVNVSRSFAAGSRLVPPTGSRPPVPQMDNYVSRQKSPHSPSSLRHKAGGSRSPTRDIDMRDASSGLITGGGQFSKQRVSISPRRHVSNDYLNQLQQDNMSLQKRLNLVLQELDRVNRDRSKLTDQMTSVQKDVTSLKSKLQDYDDADRLNGGLQVDVNGQRDNNVNIKCSITETDMSRKDCMTKLRGLQVDRDRRSRMTDELKDDLAKKMALCQQLEQEQYHAHEKINDLERQISALGHQGHSDDAEVEQIKSVIDKLADERDDLHAKLDQLRRAYDNCVSEISREKAQMHGHNRHHNKLLVAKITFSLLEHMFQKRKQEAMNEFFQYCKFDSKCHDTLKQFVKVVERLGQFKQRIAIKQWHQRTFKPIEMKIQEHDLCYDFMRKKLLSRMFNQWRLRQQNAANMYGAKTKALESIWFAKSKDCAKDVQRAFQMWKDNMNYARFRNQRCKKLVWKAYSNKLAKAFQKWVNYSSTMTAQMRYHILARTFAENQLKRITFCTMRYNLNEMRRKRLNRLRTYVKAWKEANEYKKFMMHANMTVLGLKKDCNKSLLKMCFDAMRISKEEEKFVMMTEALEQDCLPAIESVNKQIEQKTQQAVRSGRNRGLDAIKNMIYRQVAEYFHKWKGVQTRQAVMINQNLKGMVVKRWQQLLREAFDLWKRGKASMEIDMQSGMVMEMQEEGSNLAAQVEDLTKQIEVKKKQVDRSGRSSLNRGTKIMKKRYLKQYFDKWAEVNRTVSNQSDGADTIRNKMRKRFLRQAFDLYKAGCARRQLEDRNEGSCEHLKRALDHRTLRKCFDSIKAYNTKNETAKRYWKILLGKMDHWMKKRAWGTWMDGGNKMKMDMVMEHQNNLTEEMTVKNNELGGLTKKHADKTARVAVMSANLQKMGQRSMANAFARAYFKRTAKAFETWKEWHRADKHREAVLRRTIDHWLKQNGKYLLAVMMNWKALAKINDTRKAIAGMDYEMGDMGLVQNGDSASFEQRKNQLRAETQALNGEIDSTMAKRSKIMAVMCENTNSTHYQSRLRHIFLHWAAHTKRMVRFSQILTNAISKSAWQRGFQNIREFSRDKQLTRDQNKSCNKLRRMFFRRTCAEAFSKWRQTEYEQTLEMIAMTCENSGGLQTDFASRKKVIQRQNITRSTRIVAKSQKWKFYQAWKNVTRWLKHKRVATENLIQGQSSYACMRAVKKWRGRAESTKFARGCYTRFMALKAKIYKRACFRVLMLKYQREKALVLRLSSVAAKFDNRGLMGAFQMIKNFSTTKQGVQSSEKAISAQKLSDVLHEIYLRKLHLFYMHARRQVFGDVSVRRKQKTAFGHMVSRRVRDAFNRWKEQAKLASTVIEVNEIGPIAEEVLDKQLDVTNLRNLMASEGFTEHQIEDVTHNAADRAQELLAKSVGRWKCWNGTDDYLKPKMFDRWRRFVAFRKIVKHWLDFIANRQEHKKADLSYCFNKWKFFFSDKQDTLQKRTRAQLMTRAVKAAKRLEVLADSTQQDEHMINHISDQNEELFNNYRKGQKLALALGRDNQRFGMMKAFKLFMENSHFDKQKHLEGILAKNIGIIAATKDKIKEFENDNEALANENEELRQFSLDGYQLGKNVTNLTQEREKLSVDLADKADTIKKLLDENERLSQRLKMAQDSVLQASRA